MNPAKLSLYVAGNNPKTEKLIAHVRSLCEQSFGADVLFEVVNVLEHPEIAERESIMATPTLVREYPLPRRHIVGDFTQTDRVLQALEMNFQP